MKTWSALWAGRGTQQWRQRPDLRTHLGRARFLLLALMASLAAAAATRAAAAEPVYVIKVQGAILPTQAAFIRDAVAQARKDRAAAIIFEINTLGGLVDSANEIKDILLEIDDVPTVAWVHNRAISAGALIALSAQKIAVAPGSTIGAASLRSGDGKPVDDAKSVSYWREEFAATAKIRGRDPDIAAAMVSAREALPTLGVPPGGVVTLSGDRALRVGYADFPARTVADIVGALDLPAASPVVVMQENLWQQVARFVVLPWATIALLTIGCLLLFIDLLTPHTWGLMGTAGAVSVGMVFAAHLTVGTAGWIGVILFLAGLTFLLLETHVFPGHGIGAIAGLMLLFVGMFWALGGSQNAMFALSVSTVLTALSLIGFFAYLPKSPIWKKLGQQMQQRASLGYVTSENMTHFLGRTGTAATVLRPSGMADIDGIRLDVITEGEFLPTGTPVVVIRVEGSRIVVDDIAIAENQQTQVA